MQKNVLIALAIIGTLTAGFFLFRNKPTKSIGTQTSDLRDIYNQWKVDYKVSVGAAEDDYRFKVFSSNYAMIQDHNELPDKTYTLGLNAFTHLTLEEFAANHLGLQEPMDVARNFTPSPRYNILKTQVDWTAKMNTARNQGMCGACWAFSAVGAIEGLYSVTKGQLFQLSEQELIDCSFNGLNQGCNGGHRIDAFRYVMAKKGLATLNEYPYTGIDGQCKTGLSNNAPITGLVYVTPNSAIALRAAIATQPVAVGIQAENPNFKAYAGGVINDVSCGTHLDHGVVAVGYNTEASIPYYKVRNSWGPSWGEAGHVRIGIQEGDGICGIQKLPLYPILD